VVEAGVAVVEAGVVVLVVVVGVVVAAVEVSPVVAPRVAARLAPIVQLARVIILAVARLVVGAGAALRKDSRAGKVPPVNCNRVNS
jgi:hypothetical protein